MNFLTYFRAFSYAMIGVAMLALVHAGGLDYALALAFLVVMVVSWRLEGTRWQLPERIGLGIVLLSIALFYLDWHYQKELGEPVERLRSEEHTSELQSHSFISYAVFCLKKK